MARHVSARLGGLDGKNIDERNRRVEALSVKLDVSSSFAIVREVKVLETTTPPNASEVSHER